MALKRINPTKMLVGGDTTRARSFLGPARSQMEILKQQMSFQNLSQGVRRVWLHKDVYVECIKVYNYQECKIWIQPTFASERGVLKTEENMLLIVYGDFERKLVVTSIVGEFKNEPVLCGEDGYGEIVAIEGSVSFGELSLYGSFVHCFDCTLEGEESNATASIDSCIRRHYQRLYSNREIIDDVVAEPGSSYSINSALDATFPSNIPCSNTNTIIRDEWSKTLDDLMVSPFVYYDFSWGAGPFVMWKVSASWKNEVIKWDDQENFGNFVRNVHTGAVSGYFDPTQWEDTHIGFDLWKEEGEPGEFEYFVGIMSDQGETLHIFKFNPDTTQLEKQTSYSSNIRGDSGPYSYMTQTRRERYVRLLGYGYNLNDDQHVAYWAIFKSGWSIPFYYKEILNGGGISTHDVSDPESVDGGEIKSALWNPIQREVYIYLESDSNEVPVTAPLQFLYGFSSVRVSHPPPGYVCYWDENGIPYTELGSWHCRDNEPTSIPLTDCPLRYVDPFNGEEHFYTAFCAGYPEGLDHFDFCSSYWTGKLRRPEEEIYMGTFNIHTKHRTKGRKTTYTSHFVAARTYAPSYPEEGENCCPDSGYQTVDTDYRGTECDPNDVKRYTFNKWIFTPGSHAYEYSDDDMTTYVPEGKDPEWNSACEWEDDWEDHSVGNLDILDAASEKFPYDKGWAAVLLEGKDQRDNLVSNWVIYKGSDGLFVVDDGGAVRKEIGEHERGFFIKHTEIREMEA